MGVEHNFPEVAYRVRAGARNMRGNRRPVLRAVGIQVLSWAFQDYRVKARGGTAPNGVKWDDIQPETLAGRLRKLQSYRKASREGKKAQVASAVARHEIGVDTGRQIAGLKVATPQNLRVDDDSVTLSAHQSYSKFFDAVRAIFGDGFITRARAAALDKLVEGMQQKQVDREFD